VDQPDAEPTLGEPGSVVLQRDGDANEELSEARSTPALTPQVVAVVVTHDPGPWFEEALSSLTEQDYPNLSILVIDAGSREDPTPRIAAVASRAFVRRLDDNPGYGAAVNVAMKMVEGAAFYLVCHDDVALARSATRLLVEEAYRSNAGIVGPKLVRWDEPGALLQVGMGADRFGVPAPLCERGELDQEQHDAVRDVFAVPGGCFLVRADLFAALDGFDEAITFHGEDTDLSWRAHLAGARVLVAPSAVARHVEALGDRRPDDRRRLQARHRLRMVLTNYGWFYLIGEGLQQLVLSLVEVVVSVVSGRFRQAGDVVGAYTWNLRRTGSMLAKRRANRRRRQLTDLEIRRLQVRGSARLTAFIRGQLGAGEAGGGSIADAGRQWLSSIRSGIARENLLLGLAVAAVVAFGSRELITGSLPAIGELVVLPDRAMDLLRGGWSGWRATGLGAPAPPPTGFTLFGLAGLVLLGGTGLLRQLLVVGMLPLGLWGAWRLGSFAPHSRAKAAALVAYAANPLPYNALAVGSWRGLAMYAAAPWMVRRLAAIGELAPFGTGAAGPDDDRAEARDGIGRGNRGGARRRLRHAAGLALVMALAMVVYPAAALVAGLVALALVVGSALVGSGAGSLRLVGATVVAAVVATALHGAWLVGAVGQDDPDLSFAGRSGGAEDHSLSSLLHFDTGVANRSVLTWGLLVAGLLGLAIGRSWRLRWAVRGWALFGLPLGLVAVVQAGWLDVRLPPAEVLLAPAAVGVSLAVASGMAAFDRDLPVYRFGWRQVASVGAAAGLLVASVPLLAGAFDGRWRMPRTGYDRTFAFMAAEAEDNGPYRVLWLGPAGALPAAGWDLGDGVAYATSIGFPSAGGLWTGPEDDAARLIPEALQRARNGDTSRLGRVFGSMGIRYVVVVSQLAPAPYRGRSAPLPTWVRSTLGEQLDLAQLDLNAAIGVFRNPAWLPMAASVPAAVTRVEDLPPVVDGASVPAPALRAVGPDARRFEGELAGGTVLHLAQARDEGWELEVDGVGVAPETGFGWANRYVVSQPGPARVGYSTPTGQRLVLLAQLVAWLAVIGVAVRRPRPAREPLELAPAAPPREPAPGPGPVEVTV
jgi:GT2 family glycosyltransferase